MKQTVDILRVRVRGRERKSDSYPEIPVLRALPECANYTETNVFLELIYQRLSSYLGTTQPLDKYLLELKLLVNSDSKIATILLEIDFYIGQRSYLKFEENLEEAKGKIERKTGKLDRAFRQ